MADVALRLKIKSAQNSNCLFNASTLLLITVELIPLLRTKLISVKLFWLNVTTAPWPDASRLVGVISREI